jgi:hypothetical protein
MIETEPCTDTSCILNLFIGLVSELNRRLVEFDIRRKKRLVLDEYTTILDPILKSGSLHPPRMMLVH